MSNLSLNLIRIFMISVFATIVSGLLFYQGISITQTPVKFLVLQVIATFVVIIPLTDLIMKAFRKNEL